MELPAAPFFAQFLKFIASQTPSPMQNNFTSLIILLIAILLLVLNEYVLNDQIPSWVFIILLVIWLIVRIRTFRNMRKK